MNRRARVRDEHREQEGRLFSQTIQTTLLLRRTVLHWASQQTSLCLSSLIWKLGITSVPITQGLRNIQKNNIFY